MKGYSGTNLTEHEDSFNAYMNSARVCVEIAFGRLKARWRCLLKRIDIHHSLVPFMVATCCTLHNIVEKHKEEFVVNWLHAVVEAEAKFEQPATLLNRFANEYEGYATRIFLTEYLARYFPIRKSKNL